MAAAALWTARRAASATADVIVILLVVAIAAGAGSLFAYRGSLLDREGPAR